MMLVRPADQQFCRGMRDLFSGAFFIFRNQLIRRKHITLFVTGSDILATPVLQQDDDHVQAHFPGNSSTLWYRADNDQWTVYRGGNQATVDADINTVSCLTYLTERYGFDVNVIDYFDSHRTSTKEEVSSLSRIPSDVPPLTC